MALLILLAVLQSIKPVYCVALYVIYFYYFIDCYPPVSSPLASAVHLYLRHSGIKLRDSKVFPGLMSEKEKWLPFFPKAKKVNVLCSILSEI